jgi:hypothetical protein
MIPTKGDINVLYARYLAISSHQEYIQFKGEARDGCANNRTERLSTRQKGLLAQVAPKKGS